MQRELVISEQFLHQRMSKNGKQIAHTCKMSLISELIFSDFFIFTDPYHKQIYQQSVYTESGQAVERRRKRATGTAANPQGMPLPPMEFPVSVDVDSAGTVYWIDRKASVIQSSPIILDESQRGQPPKLLRQIPQGRNKKRTGDLCRVGSCWRAQPGFWLQD